VTLLARAAVTELHAELERASAETAKKDGLGTLAKQQLRSRSRAFIESKLMPVISSARDAAEMNPPRITAIIDRLDQIQEEILKESEWLASSE
jgi:hypothetical protein